MARRRAAASRRDSVRQDEPADLGGRYPELQRCVRDHEQPVEPRPHPRRIVGRFLGRARHGVHPDRVGQRHRWIDPGTRPLLGRDGPQAELCARARPRPDSRASGDVDHGRPRRSRTDGPHGSRPAHQLARDGRTGPLEQPGMAGGAAAGSKARAARLPHRCLDRRRLLSRRRIDAPCTRNARRSASIRRSAR